MAKRDDEHEDEFPLDDESLDEGDWDEDDSDLDADEEEEGEEEDEESWGLEKQYSSVSPAEGEDTPARRAGLLRFEEALTLEGQIEAVLFASPKALRVEEILEIVQTDDMAYNEQAIAAVLDQLVRLYTERNGGFRLEVLKGAYQFQTVPAAAPLMERLFSSRPRPLSRAALETLAIIAYRQPVTRADVEFIRGVDAGSIIKNLLERDLIACVGRKEDAGRPMLFGTTQTFLEVFRLNNIKDLPPLSAFQPAQEMVTEAANKLEGEEAVDVEGFVADLENRELSEDERDFLATESEAAETEEEESQSAENLDLSDFEAAAEESSDTAQVSAEEVPTDAREENAHDDSYGEEDGALAGSEEVVALKDHPADEDTAEAEAQSDNPFWELELAAQKASKSQGRVLKGASAKKRGVRNDKDGADAASEMDSSARSGIEAGSRDLDPSRED